MSIHRRPAGVTAPALLVVAVLLCVAMPPGGVAAQTARNAQRFPNVELTTHKGARVRFNDLIHGKTVAIELMSTTCTYACPLETARMAQVQSLLGDRMGRDVFFYSITIDPAYDTPEVLNAYAEKYHAGPGWTFLTGNAEDIELLSKSLGLYSRPDPANKDGHTPTLLIGNEATGQWVRGSALDNAKLTATMIANWVGGYPNAAAPVKSYAEAKPLPKFSSGEYLFSTKCSACHSLGRADKTGPDLADITGVRDRRWLAKFIADPDQMLKDGDGLAKALLSEYRQMRMPSLELSDQEIQDLLTYLDGVRPRTSDEVSPHADRQVRR